MPCMSFFIKFFIRVFDEVQSELSQIKGTCQHKIEWDDEEEL